MDQLKKLASGLGVIPKGTEHRRGHGFTRGLLNASHDHAHVRGLYDDPDARGINSLENGLGNLFG